MGSRVVGRSSSAKLCVTLHGILAFAFTNGGTRWTLQISIMEVLHQKDDRCIASG